MKPLILLLASLPVMGQIVRPPETGTATITIQSGGTGDQQGQLIFAGRSDYRFHGHHPLWLASLAAYEAANTADLITSLHGVEGNPLLGSGPFGSRQITTKLSLMGAVAVAEALVIRRWPRTRRALAYFNFAGAGVTGAVAWRNERVK